MMTLPLTDAEAIAMDFLMGDLEIPDIDREFFSVVSAKETGSDWFVVKIGVEGLPDQWVLQVFDTGQCDPCYTFLSPMPPGEDADLEEFPPRIADAIAVERSGSIH
ncbi:MAG: hypothetical protein AB4050_20725 [Synechococcus sp.]